MRSLFRYWVLAAVLGGSLLWGGCAREASPVPGQGDDVGAIELSLQLTPGLTISALNYTITGPNAFSRTGVINLASSSSITATLGGIPVGNGYNLTVAALASDGATTCGGAAVFNVTRSSLTLVMLHLVCREPPRTGSIEILGTVNVCPVIDSLTANPGEVLVGGTIDLAGAAHDSNSAPAPISYQWTATAGMLSSASSPNTTFTCTGPGPVAITLAALDGDCSDSAAVTVTCTANPAADAGAAADSSAPADVAPVVPVVVFNEVESNGGTPGDWAELLNAGTAPADISGWIFKDNDDTHAYAIPAGTVLPPGGFFVLEEAAFGFGLGANESVRLYTSATGPLVASHAWTAHAATTYRRCPDATGPWGTAATATKGAANDCGAATHDAGAPDATGAPDASVVTIQPWPGQNAVVTADNLNQFGDNLSGLVYEPAQGAAPAVLWAALNGPGSLFRMVSSGAIWTFDTADGWGAGKTLRYPGGTGNPDTESLTRAELTAPFVYTSVERNNDASSVSRLSILRFDSSAPGTVLTATHEWNLTADLPAVGANLGLEAITWIPDSHLVANAFKDEARGGIAYDPAFYPDHGTGLFVVGVEGTGSLHAYALDHAAGTFQKVATFASGHPGVMGLEFDRETGALWANCDNTCAGTQNVLGVVAGKFVVRKIFARPSSLPDSNNEGIAIAPESECVGGWKKFFWADDSHFAGHALRIDSIPCGPLF